MAQKRQDVNFAQELAQRLLLGAFLGFFVAQFVGFLAGLLGMAVGFGTDIAVMAWLVVIFYALVKNDILDKNWHPLKRGGNQDGPH